MNMQALQEFMSAPIPIIRWILSVALYLLSTMRLIDGYYQAAWDSQIYGMQVYPPFSFGHVGRRRAASLHHGLVLQY